jgi:hypothetical protein
MAGVYDNHHTYTKKYYEDHRDKLIEMSRKYYYKQKLEISNQPEQHAIYDRDRNLRSLKTYHNKKLKSLNEKIKDEKEEREINKLKRKIKNEEEKLQEIEIDFKELCKEKTKNKLKKIETGVNNYIESIEKQEMEDNENEDEEMIN